MRSVYTLEAAVAMPDTDPFLKLLALAVYDEFPYEFAIDRETDEYIQWRRSFSSVPVAYVASRYALHVDIPGDQPLSDFNLLSFIYEQGLRFAPRSCRRFSQNHQVWPIKRNKKNKKKKK